MAADTAVRFGRNLFMARRRAGFSQEELAGLCSLHRTEIGLLEHGRRLPRVDTFLKLVAALEARPADLLNGIAWVPGGEGSGTFITKP
ncbi:MAG TPA: helix-turn-helix transcriptional regulator [Solirubrobacterales bacterium]|nr:helix-turn-helix transcriptional regulator [Solirubrobacterales bacterium]